MTTSPCSRPIQNIMKLGSHKQVFQDCWLAFLNIPDLPPKIFNLCLSCIPELLIPNFAQPQVLLSFLTESYNLSEDAVLSQARDHCFDEEVSLLALHGIFLLMVDHNL